MQALIQIILGLADNTVMNPSEISEVDKVSFYSSAALSLSERRTHLKTCKDSERLSAFSAKPSLLVLVSLMSALQLDGAAVRIRFQSLQSLNRIRSKTQRLKTADLR